MLRRAVARVAACSKRLCYGADVCFLMCAGSGLSPGFIVSILTVNTRLKLLIMIYFTYLYSTLSAIGMLCEERRKKVDRL